MPATFDGINLVITLPAATPVIDAEVDLYSEWKKWALLEDNLSLDPAFRTVAGDPLTPGIDAGAYFFIRNDLGWRIRPAEEDATVLFTGNLVPEDSSLPVAVPTLGDFTVMILGLQPITQSVDTLLTLQQETLYQGAVYLDTLDGVTGTAFPVGTASEPSSNMAEAMTIAAGVGSGVRRMFVRGPAMAIQSMVGWTISGVGAESSVDFNGQDFSGTLLENIDVEGDLPALSQQMTLRHCEVETAGITGFRGHLSFCRIEGNVGLAAGHSTLFKCASDLAGASRPILDASGVLVDLSIRDWVGGLELRNFSLPGCVASFDLDSAALRLAATVTDGVIVVRGLGTLEDSSGPGIVPDHTGLIRPDRLRLATQVIAGRAEVSLDDLTVTVYDEDNVTVLGVFDVSADGRLRTPQ